MGHGRELTFGIGAAVLAAASLAILWQPADWAPRAVGVGLDVAAGLVLVGLTYLALKARFDFVRAPSGGQASVAGSVAVGVVFALILIMLFSGATYALTAKHHLFAPFAAPPTRLEALAFWTDQALKGALFDGLEIFDVDLPGAPAFDARAQWGLGLVAAVFRFAAALGVWSLIFAYVAFRKR